MRDKIDKANEITLLLTYRELEDHLRWIIHNLLTDSQLDVTMPGDDVSLRHLLTAKDATSEFFKQRAALLEQDRKADQDAQGTHEGQGSTGHGVPRVPQGE